MLTLALIQTPTSLIADGDFKVAIAPEWKFSNVQATRSDGTLTLRFAPKPDAQPWDAVVHHVNTSPIAEGDVVLFRARLRSRTKSRLGVNYELASPPNSKFLSQVVNLSPDWKEVRLAGRAPRAFAPGEAQLALFFGYGPGEVEMANVGVDNLGKVDLQKVPQTIDFFGGAANPDTWRKAALQRIERIRKRDLVIRVVDRAGRRVPNAQVSVEQTRHRFRFGTAVPAARIVEQSPDGERFRATLERLFNTITFENDLKWNRLRDQDYTQVDQVLKWLNARKFNVRGHNLVWGAYRYLPQEMQALDREATRKIIEERTRASARRFRGKVYLWDVVNEAVTETELWEKAGWDLFPEVFKIARQEDPNALLCYNDFNITEENQFGPSQRLRAMDRIRQIQTAGAPVDVFGIQAHVGTPITPTQRVIEILDEVAKLGPRLEITEYDLGVQDDRIHGEHMRDFLTACFSHPSVDAFVMWGFWANSHWRANEGGAMFRSDWTARPAARIWEDLVKRQWWTRAQLRANGRGESKVRGFLGTHRITVTAKGKKVSQTLDLKPGRGATELTVILP